MRPPYVRGVRVPAAVELGERWLKVVTRPIARSPQSLDWVVKPIANLSNEQITQAVASAFRELRVKPKPLVVCLPRNLVTLRNLHLPSQNPEEIAQMIDLNLPRLVPYRKEEVLSSYQLVGTDEIGQTKVLLAIVHRELIQRQVKLLESAGLSVDQILLSSHGVWEWLLSSHQDDLHAQGLSLLLDVDAGFTDFIICSRDSLLFSRSIAIEPSQLTEPTGLSKLLGEVTQALAIFQSEERPEKPATLFLSGAHAAVGHLERSLGPPLELPVVRVHGPEARSRKGTPAPGREIPEEVSLTAVVAIASVERRKPLAFVLPEMQIQRALKERTRELVRLGSLGIYLLTAVCGVAMTRTHYQQAYLQNIRARHEAISRQIGELAVQSQRLELVKASLNERQLPLVYLAELQRIVPQDIAISFLSLDGQRRGVIRGHALRLSDVLTLITTLERSGRVGQVETKYARRKRLKDQEITEFELALQVRL